MTKTNTFRRVFGLLCALALLLTILPAPARAEGDGMTYTDDLVELVKRYEGFTATAYNDGTGWYIGYGSSCGRYEYPNGITEAEAEVLLRTQLDLSRDVVNRFMKRNGVRFTQNEFDALSSLVYNIGYRWLSQDTRLTNAILNGQSQFSDLDIVNFFGVFCHFGGSVSRGLAKRRIEEACVFRFGDYTQEKRQQYTYIIFDAGEGEMESDVRYYVKGEPYGEFPDAVRSGYTLAGWETESGILKPSDIAEGIRKASAVWAPGGPVLPSDPVEPTEPSKPTQPTQPPKDFADVSEGQWFYDSVRYLSSTGAVNGYPDGSFRPQESVTVGQALKVILLASGFDEQAPVNEHWASGYAAFAVMEGMLTASEAANLNAPATRLLTAQVSAQSMGLEYSYGPSPFPDTDDGFVVALYEEGIITGAPEGNKVVYKPDSSLTRAELCTIVQRMAQR